MARSSQLARNVFSNGAGFLISAVVGIALAPMVKDHLGVDGYGFWGLLVACQGTYSLLDAGIRSAVGQYVTRYWARDEIENVSRTLSTAVGLMALTGIGVALLTGVMALVGPSLFELKSTDDSTASLLFLIVGLGVALNFPLIVAQSATFARQRFDISNGIAISETLAKAGLTVLALKSGHGLVALALIGAGTQTAANLSRILVARKLLPGVQIARRHFRRENVKELYGYSVFTVLINAGDQVLTNSAAFVLGIVLSDEAFGRYRPGSDLVFYGVMLISQIAWTLTPQATARDATGDLDAVRRMWIQGSRLILTFGALIVGGIIATSGDFIRLWMGPEFLEPEPYGSSVDIAIVLSVGLWVRSMMTTGRQILIGMREVRAMARVSLLEAGLTIALSFALVPRLGLCGCAYGAAIAAAIAQLGVMPHIISRKLGVPVSQFFREVPLPGLAVVAAMLLTESLVAEHLPVDSWLDYIAKAAAVTAPGLLIGLLVGTTSAEKTRLGRRLGLCR